MPQNYISKRIESFVYSKKHFLETTKKNSLPDAIKNTPRALISLKNKIFRDWNGLAFGLKKPVLKQGTILLACFSLLSTSYSFNFPTDLEKESSIPEVSAFFVDENEYKFNDADYLDAGHYKVTAEKNSATVIDYTVEPGDNLNLIANRFDISTATLMGVNKIGEGEIITPGQKLKVLSKDGILVKVEKGESFASLATKYEVSEKVIRRFNNKDQNYTLKISDELVIPGAKYIIPKPSRNQNIAIAGRSQYTSSYKKSYNPVNSSGRLMMPVKGVLTQKYHSGHPGLDIANKSGTTVYAAEGGTVEKVNVGNYGGGYGNYIVINHGGGLRTLYGHLSKVFVGEGQKIDRGESIGAVGNTGRSTGPHLHFEVHDGKRKYNPYAYL